MKGTEVIFTKQNYDQDIEEITGKVVSEPYPKLTSGFGAPPRDGGTYSTTDSRTCVVVECDKGALYFDVPVHDLKKYEPPLTFLGWLDKRNLNTWDFESTRLRLEKILANTEADVDEYNKEVDTIKQSVEDCSPKVTPCPTKYLKDYFGTIKGFVRVWKPTYGAPNVEFRCERVIPALSTEIFNSHNYWGMVEPKPDYIIIHPYKLVADTTVLEKFIAIQDKFETADLWSENHLSEEEVYCLNKVMEILYGVWDV